MLESRMQTSSIWLETAIVGHRIKIQLMSGNYEVSPLKAIWHYGLEERNSLNWKFLWRNVSQAFFGLHFLSQWYSAWEWEKRTTIDVLKFNQLFAHFFPRRLLSCSQLLSEEVSSCSRRVIIISPSDFAIDSEMYQSSLDEAAKSYALEYLGESEEVAAASVLEIQKFLTDNPEINAHSDPRSILCFLRSCKFNVEQTKIRIKR